MFFKRSKRDPALRRSESELCCLQQGVRRRVGERAPLTSYCPAQLSWMYPAPQPLRSIPTPWNPITITCGPTLTFTADVIDTPPHARSRPSTVSSETEMSVAQFFDRPAVALWWHSEQKMLHARAL
jgi:hypothetical protein